ncbi:MAG: hypothetical protein LBM05_00025 [Endomicrobium sp.]|jgi:F0F1-type ATP synthase delta subunit|nr:hypothetical protein [Endomicrobium sp.]
MRKIQIHDLVKSIVKYNGLSYKELNWIYSKFTIQELTQLQILLDRAIQTTKVLVFSSHDISKNNKSGIRKIYNKNKVVFLRNDKQLGGLYIEYNYYIFDYTITNILTNIIKILREYIND